MKLDTSRMRYLTPEDFRVLQAVELGSRNHELVPTQMIHSIGKLKSPSATNRAIGDLAKLKLVARLRNAKYDGFRLTYLGHDYLALRSMLKRDTIYSLGSTIGVGKESDIYSVSDTKGKQRVLKIHRLGRTSFTSVKRNRDYLQKRHTSSWMYLSKLAANKEYDFMKILYDNGFKIPIPFDYSRHCVLMEWIDGITMKLLSQYKNPKKLYSELMQFIVKLANHGLIHCDFNEFNLIIRNPETSPQDGTDFVVIDFPQCVSIQHPDAEAYFDRDVQGIRAFFERKFNYTPEDDPIMFDTDGYGDGYKYAYPKFKRDVKRIKNLDVEVEASGFSKKKSDDRDLNTALETMREGDNGEDVENGDDGDDDGEGNNEKDNREEEADDDNDDDDDESDYESEYESESDEDQDANNQQLEAQTKEENEKIIDALTKGTKELKIDKLGNYILDE